MWLLLRVFCYFISGDCRTRVLLPSLPGSYCGQARPPRNTLVDTSIQILWRHGSCLKDTKPGGIHSSWLRSYSEICSDQYTPESREPLFSSST